MIGVKFLFDELPAARRSPRIIWAAAAIGLLFAASSCLDVARLAGLEDYRLGRLRLSLDRQSISELERVGEMIPRYKGMVYCEPALSGLAFNPPLPAPNFADYGYFHRLAADRGLLRGPGPEGLLAQHCYPLIVLKLNDRAMLDVATKAGYIRQPGWNHITVLEAPPGMSQQQAGRENPVARDLSLRAN